VLTEELPSMPGSTLLLALTGWMDGGAVSTGTVRQLMEGRNLIEIARIDPTGFYIENFPGSMEIAALFRPEVKYESGLITEYEVISNTFHADLENNMLFFTGKEPNLGWDGFARCIFHVVRACKVSRILFMGSFGGAVPHTREPRLFGSVSGKHLLPILSKFALKPSDYEGPGSFASYLLYLSPENKVDMISLAAEIPGYLQGQNPVSIEAVARRLAAVLELEVDLSSLRRASTEWELKVSEAVEKDKELRKRVRKLEEEYDNELIADENA
jgi:proteasome assembly chaperone (PAC2) family protein